MPSKGEVNLFLLNSNIVANCVVFGIDIIPSSNKLRPTNSKLKLALHYLFIAWVVLFTSFASCRAYNCIANNVVPLNSKCFGITQQLVYTFLAAGHLMSAIWFIVLAIYKTEMANLWNQLVHFLLNGMYFINIFKSFCKGKYLDNQNFQRNRERHWKCWNTS